MIFAFLLMALVLTVTAFILRKPPLSFGAAGAWMLTGVYSRSVSAYTWDVYYGLFFLCIGFVILCALEPVLMRPKGEKKEDDAPLDEIERTEKEYAELSRQTRIPRIGRHSSRSKKGPIY